MRGEKPPTLQPGVWVLWNSFDFCEEDYSTYTGTTFEVGCISGDSKDDLQERGLTLTEWGAALYRSCDIEGLSALHDAADMVACANNASGVKAHFALRIKP